MSEENKHFSNECWPTPSQDIPLPEGACETLQEYLACVPKKPGKVKSVTPKPTFRWEVLQKMTDLKNGKTAKALAEQYKVSVEASSINGVTVFELVPSTLNPQFDTACFLHLHGGAYLFGAGISGTVEAIKLAHHLQIRVVSVDYRMPPAHIAPAALNDVVSVYPTLRAKHSTLFMGGSSAGGGLTMATIHQLKKDDQTLPEALFVGTPWADLTKTGDSYYTCARMDHQLITYEGVLEGATQVYAPEMDLKDPLLSPIYGEFDNFPPSFLVTGTRDLFLSNTIRADIALKKAGVPTELLVFEGMAHEDYMQLEFEDRNKESQTLKDAHFFFEQLKSFLQKNL